LLAFAGGFHHYSFVSIAQLKITESIL